MKRTTAGGPPQGGRWTAWPGSAGGRHPGFGAGRSPGAAGRASHHADPVARAGRAGPPGAGGVGGGPPLNRPGERPPRGLGSGARGRPQGAHSGTYFKPDPRQHSGEGTTLLRTPRDPCLTASRHRYTLIKSLLSSSAPSLRNISIIILNRPQSAVISPLTYLHR